MAATEPASRAVASLMPEGDPLPEAPPVIPISFPYLASAFRPECAPQASPSHPPCGQKFGGAPSTHLREHHQSASRRRVAGPNRGDFVNSDKNYRNIV